MHRAARLTFSQQAVGGTVWHGIKGFRNSPYGERRIGAITAVKMRAPVLGGNFGVWGGLFSTFDCAVRGVRRKEDPFNAIAAGFLTGGSLAIRGGFRAARNGAIGCAVLLAVIEGVGIGFQKMLAGSTKLEVSCRPLEEIESMRCSSMRAVLTLTTRLGPSASGRKPGSGIRPRYAEGFAGLDLLHESCRSVRAANGATVSGSLTPTSTAGHPSAHACRRPTLLSTPLMFAFSRGAS